MVNIARAHMEKLLKAEELRFHETHQKSYQLYKRARKSLHGGVPMLWMIRWAGTFPIFVDEGKGAHFTDVDGNRYIDFCLGDTGAMTGHAPDKTVEAITKQVGKGITYMLPTEDVIWVGEELQRRFGLPYWQFTLTATDANRFAIRMAREVTQRKYILVYNYCYHGSVDETFITIGDKGVGPRRGNLGPPVNPAETTKVIEFNDIEALESALAPGDVACVLAEPAMTNIGIIHPDPGYHAALREITRRTGTLLIIDETHSICTGPRGYTGAYKLEPDMFTLGKPLAGGVPAAVYGFSQEVADRFAARLSLEDSDVGGIGGTLAGNALSIAAMRATLEYVLTEAAYERAIGLAVHFANGVQSVIDEKHLPWIVKRLGCRSEYWFREKPPRNGREAFDAIDSELDRYMHLYSLNQGILMTPFHNMALIAPDTTRDDVDYHTQVFRNAVENLLNQ
ncbi:MAG: aspartate aminotransferase family protein [Anaerolineales bacterium]|nr:MAG: aspartate aminotransferase family protein [Anaerolineales bacterium]